MINSDGTADVSDGRVVVEREVEEKKRGKGG